MYVIPFENEVDNMVLSCLFQEARGDRFVWRERFFMVSTSKNIMLLLFVVRPISKNTV